MIQSTGLIDNLFSNGPKMLHIYIYIKVSRQSILIKIQDDNSILFSKYIIKYILVAHPFITSSLMFSHIELPEDTLVWGQAAATEEEQHDEWGDEDLGL